MQQRLPAAVLTLARLPARHRRATTLAAAAGYLAVVVLRIALGPTADAVGMFLSLPVAALALSYDLTGGLAAATSALATIATWTTLSGPLLSPLDWVARALPMFLVGTLVGALAGQLRRTQTHHDHAHHHRNEALRISDDLLQGLIAVKWSLENGHLDRGLDIATRAVNDATRRTRPLIQGANAYPGTADGLGLP